MDLNYNISPEQLEQIKKLMSRDVGMMGTPMSIPVPEPELHVPNLTPPPTVANDLAVDVNNFAAPQQDQPDLTPATPTPQTGMFQASGNEVYDNRIQELMDRGMTYDAAVANQQSAINQFKDINGDGIVTDDEWGSNYTSAANPDVDNRYKDTGQGMGSVYISSAKDDNGIAGGGKFESLQRANDALLGEGQQWGFSDGATGQWGTYGGPGFSHSAEKIAEIDLDRTGYGTSGLVGGDMNLGKLYEQAEWTQADVHRGAHLGQVIETPMGEYMVVNGMDGQLALKGLKGARHGGGDYFFRTVDEGYHMGIDPTTGDVWFQQAPGVVDLARQVKDAGGDFTTAMTAGLGSGDLGVWDQERIDQFNNSGVNDRVNDSPQWSKDWDWGNNTMSTGGTFLDAYLQRKNEMANKKSVKSLFREMQDYGY